MSRLQIPLGITILGALDVGITNDNFQEVCNWVSSKFETFEHTETIEVIVDELEKELREILMDRFTVGEA